MLLWLVWLAAAAEPVDLNVATEPQLSAMSGIGPQRASLLIAWREAHGPFTALEETLAIPGFGHATLTALSAQVQVAPGSPPQQPELKVQLNRATAAELAALPAIPPAVAERIVQDRERNGPFDSCHDLLRITGIGPATVAAVQDQCATRP